MLANVGDLVNKGIEVSLSASILRQKDLTLDANLTFAITNRKSPNCPTVTIRL